MRPWHFEHFSASVRNTRLRRRAQGSRLTLGSLLRSISRDSPSPTLSAPAASALAAPGAGGAGGVGTTLGRSLAAGPRMPWYRTRWQRGRGINGISFSIGNLPTIGTPGQTGAWPTRLSVRHEAGPAGMRLGPAGDGLNVEQFGLRLGPVAQMASLPVGRALARTVDTLVAEHRQSLRLSWFTSPKQWASVCSPRRQI